MKSGRRPGRIYHMMHATTDVMFSLLTSGFFLSPSFFFPLIQFVLSVQFVLQVRLLLDWSWLATVRDVSHSTHHVINPSRPSPAFRTASDKSWVWRPGNEARIRVVLFSGWTSSRTSHQLYLIFQTFCTFVSRVGDISLKATSI